MVRARSVIVICFPQATLKTPVACDFNAKNALAAATSFYINEVASLPAVSENRNRLVPDRFLNKSRNDRAIFISRILVGTKNVKITKGNSGESPFIREGATVPFAFILACRHTDFSARPACFQFLDWLDCRRRLQPSC